MTVRIATRRSPLALWQANHVAQLLQAANPGLDVELVGIDTAADLDLSRSIDQIGGKGAFSKEIQQLVLADRADLAVHSAKDLQATIPDGLVIGAYPERGTVHDCLVGARLADLPSGATVATGSARRRALLLDVRPDLNVAGLRGNIGTRLSRLADHDAIVMAAVALERLGEEPDVVDDLDPESFVPQVGQGALAVECRAIDERMRELLASIDHEPTRVVVGAERSFLAELGGDCDLPAGANAQLGSDGKLTIRGVLAPDRNGALLRGEVVELPGADPGAALAQRLRGGDAAGPGDRR
ncbi:MAG: hydroxymethylbilane synthase [Acidimicrobiia bacterium]|nr:hydroxymethylbilane synthase [Acidimicrobiia bacterium]